MQWKWTQVVYKETIKPHKPMWEIKGMSTTTTTTTSHPLACRVVGGERILDISSQKSWHPLFQDML